MFGALAYNQNKVDSEEAKVLFSNRMLLSEDGNFSIGECMRSFEMQMPVQLSTKKPILHISINPHPEDVLTDQQLSDIAKEYMRKLGYGDQPYLVYKHTDIDRHHIHIVGLRVDENGKPLNDKFEHRRSKQITRELEQKYKRVRDDSRELTLMLEKKNQDLLKKQDTEVYLATLKERNRIAREIHDNVGHMLSRSILMVGALKTVNQAENLKVPMEQLDQTLNEAMTNVRQSVHDLHDESVNLKEVMESLAEEFRFCPVQLTYDMGYDIPKEIKKYGKDTCIFSTYCPTQDFVIGLELKYKYIVAEQCCPTPTQGYPAGMNLKITKDIAGDYDAINKMISDVAKKNGVTGRLSTWPISMEAFQPEFATEVAIQALKGDIKLTDIDALRKIAKDVTGVSVEMEKLDGKYDNYLLYIMGSIYY